MNIFNRVIVVLLFIILSTLLIAAAVLPEQMLEAMRNTLSAMVITPLDRIVLVFAAAIVTIISLFVIAAEVRPPRAKGVRLRQISGGTAELSTESIAARIKQTVEALADIREAIPLVKSHGSSVDVAIALVASQGIDVSQKAADVVQAVRDLLEKDIRVKVGKLRVNIKYDKRESGAREQAGNRR